jgi:hypothetical protein
MTPLQVLIDAVLPIAGSVMTLAVTYLVVCTVVAVAKWLRDPL